MKNSISYNQDKRPQAVANNLVIQELKDETLIYNLVENRAVCLNQTAAFVWNKCDGQTSIAEIAKQLARKTDQPVNEDIVWLALDLLKKESLISDDGLTDSHFSGMTRREMIRQVGLGTMISLPAISSLVAPVAAVAASGGSSQGFCDAPCLAGVCSCPSGTLQCPPGFLLSVGVGATAGVCVSAGVAVSALGINIDANLDGTVCAAVAACVRI